VPTAIFAIPGDIELPTGGYTYDRRVLDLLPERGISVRHAALPGSFPFPTATDLALTARILAAVPAGSVLLVDGLAFGALPAEIVAAVRPPIVAVVHHPLCLQAGLTPEIEERLRETETAALALAARVIVTSPATARLLSADFGVPPDRITVAEPGTDPAPRARGTGSPLRLLSVGSIIPRKGYDVLIEALAPLSDLHWTLDIIGALDRSPDTVSRLKAAIAAADLAPRVALPGPASPAELARLYDAADLFVLPSLFEGYGMVLTEAMARGLPIVCTTGGAAAQTVPDAAALKVPPGDAEALSRALKSAIVDRRARERLGDAGWAAAQVLPRWQDTAARIAEVIKGIA